MMAVGRVLHVALDLLDHQLRDRDGYLCGKVDDLELHRSPDTGDIYVTAILSGSGALLYRLGRRRIGQWLGNVYAGLAPPAAPRPGRIPIDRISQFGPVIDLATSADELVTHAAERWCRDHIIQHIPGGRADEAE